MSIKMQLQSRGLGMAPMMPQIMPILAQLWSKYYNFVAILLLIIGFDCENY
jgi:hypothetical protein